MKGQKSEIEKTKRAEGVAQVFTFAENRKFHQNSEVKSIGPSFSIAYIRKKQYECFAEGDIIPLVGEVLEFRRAWLRDLFLKTIKFFMH